MLVLHVRKEKKGKRVGEEEEGRGEEGGRKEEREGKGMVHVEGKGKESRSREKKQEKERRCSLVPRFSPHANEKQGGAWERG